jgi:hypothetical protein
MKIVHVPYVDVMYTPFNIHLNNMINIEKEMGIINSSVLLQRCLSDDFPNCDILHIHGFPTFEKSLSMLNLIKTAIIKNIKIVISLYNYSILCKNATFTANEKICNNNCNQCSIIRETLNFLQKIPIFTYSNFSTKLLKENGFGRVFKMPIVYWNSTYDYIKKDFDESSRKKIGFFLVDKYFDKEYYIKMQLQNEFEDIHFYDIDHEEKFSVNYILCPYSWPTSFPYEIGCALNEGTPVITDKNFISDEYSELNDAILKFDILNEKESVYKQMCLTLPIEKRHDLAYRFWSNYGPDHCIAYYHSIYQTIYNQ